MSWREYYKEHCVSMEELINQLPKDHITFSSPSTTGEPKAIHHAMIDRGSEFNACTVNGLMCIGEFPFMAPELEGHIRFSTAFAGTTGDMRRSIHSGIADFVPMYYHQYPRYVRECLKPDVAILHVAPPDEHGWCSFGVMDDFEQAAYETASFVVAQINDRMPRTFGQCQVHITQIDLFTEVSQPIPAAAPSKIGPVEQAIGGYCASLIHDRDCLQLGIGAIPDAVLSQLTDKHDLGIHTEMLADGVMELMNLGNINNRYKNLDRNISTTTFAMGTQKLYDFVHNNPSVAFYPVDRQNDPRVICQQDNMVTVNSALQVDLFGQVAADTIGSLQYSGVGGQVDFVRGANMSRGGRNIIAFPSTAQGGKTSRISVSLPEHGTVTTNRFDADYIITEYGIAQLWGKNLTQRAEALIAIAHPDFRDELKASFRELYK